MQRAEWTTDQKLARLMLLPWHIAVERDPVDGSHVLQIVEIPDAIGTGETIARAAADLWQSLKASLAVRLEHGDPLPVPSGIELPWDAGQEAPARLPVVPVRLSRGEAWEQAATVTGATFALPV